MLTAVVTGSEGQLGRTFCSKLKSLGYQVVGFDTANQVNDNIIFHQVDITESHSIGNAMDKLENNIDLLINNAGVSVFSPFEERTDEDLDHVIGVNLKGTILMTQIVFNRFFKPCKKGCIVNLGSIYGVVAGDMTIYGENDRRTPEVYGATKAAIINLTKYFAAYMAPYNVRVNCISPGGIFADHNADFVNKYSLKVPLQRMGNVEDILSTLEYLIAEKSSYVTGQNIVIDGGLTAW
tara:strand:+ start:4280 stop:4990 length:711 start_codon:yes stop_codon:yes gene_type:complete